MDLFLYLILLGGGEEPDCQGPFVTEDERSEAAREYRGEGFEGVIIPMDIHSDSEPIKIEILDQCLEEGEE